MSWQLIPYDSDGQMNTTGGCAHLTLLKGGTIIFNDTYSVILTQNAVFEPACNTHPAHVNPSTVLNTREPFYASTFPQMYAVAAATVISYLLLIMLFITPRTFFIGGRGGGFLSRHGMISGSYGSSSVIGVGGRPWLQKVAALTVVISLSIATADSFEVAKRQYDLGYMDSMALTDEVVNGVEIRIVRVISSTFLWLAQVQTLIRLFPRHKEKVIIKWVGFAMIVLDTIFSILNNTTRQTTNTLVRPRHIVDAIPALNYLFELSLSLLYAAWVIFYSISKHRFAFFHVNMRNICLVALLSLVAVLIPVVFFILDVSKPNVAGWGEYIRWVGAAAASVVVWEWVERIEALEREERKDGILGREIFDGDEMLEVTPSKEVDSPPSRRGGNSDGKGSGCSSRWAGMMGLSHRTSKYCVRFHTRPQHKRKRLQQKVRAENTMEPIQGDYPTVPPQAITPVSRADTASTVYRVRYHSIGSLSTSISDMTQDEEDEKELTVVRTKESDRRNSYTGSSPIPHLRNGMGWLTTLNPFRRRRGSPPQEVASAQAEEGNIRHPTPTKHGDEAQANSPLKAHFGAFRSFLNRSRGEEPEDPQGTKSVLPVTVIPARPHMERTISQATTHHSESPQSGTDTRNHRTEMPLPVVVIPARPRVVKAWDSSAFEEYVRSQPYNVSSPQHDRSRNPQNLTSPMSPQPPGGPNRQYSADRSVTLTTDSEDVAIEEGESVEYMARSPNSPTSSGRTLTNPVSPTLGVESRSQFPAEQQTSSRHHSRLWGDSGGTGSIS
ncbi:pH-response regulator protein palH/rim21 [Emydomyces testavorans]|uniref:PH-response regulator protein palH/rim21 n=1 Tax=Emydomyces testavorans TaxID=2070801 RepID=A0AAF0DMR0_9EURO|nr:pH-response regulator protein palH/rim21 [Emydomyces testavorans]